MLAVFWPGFLCTPLPAPGLLGLRGAVIGQKARLCLTACAERPGQQAHRWALWAGQHPVSHQPALLSLAGHGGPVYRWSEH